MWKWCEIEIFVRSVDKDDICWIGFVVFSWVKELFVLVCLKEIDNEIKVVFELLGIVLMWLLRMVGE